MIHKNVSTDPSGVSQSDGWKCLHRAVASWSALWSRDPSADFTALNKILAAHNPFDSSSEDG